MMNFVNATMTDAMPSLSTVLGLETTRPVKVYRLSGTNAIIETGDVPRVGQLVGDGTRDFETVTREQAAWLLRSSRCRLFDQTERIA